MLKNKKIELSQLNFIMTNEHVKSSSCPRNEFIDFIGKCKKVIILLRE